EPPGKLLELDVALVESGPHPHPLGTLARQRDLDATVVAARRGPPPGDILPVLRHAVERLGEAHDGTVDHRPHLDRTTEQPRHRRHSAISDTARDDVLEHG